MHRSLCYAMLRHSMAPIHLLNSMFMVLSLTFALVYIDCTLVPGTPQLHRPLFGCTVPYSAPHASFLYSSALLSISLLSICCTYSLLTALFAISDCSLFISLACSISVARQMGVGCRCAPSCLFAAGVLPIGPLHGKSQAPSGGAVWSPANRRRAAPRRSCAGDHG